MTDTTTDTSGGSATDLTGAASVGAGAATAGATVYPSSTDPAAPGDTGIQGGSPASTAAPEGAPAAVADAPKEPVDVAPIEYKEFTFPEGFQKDDTLLSKFTALAKEAKLPQDEAQRLIDLQVEVQNELMARGQKMWADTNNTWQNEVKADPEVGGANLDATIAVVAKTIDQFGGKDAQAIRDALLITGAGNNPALVKYISRMSKQLVEGGPLQGRTSSTVSRDPAKTLYPNQP